jgi:Holliday junction resolvase RusA-like endonuclease
MRRRMVTWTNLLPVQQASSLRLEMKKSSKADVVVHRDEAGDYSGFTLTLRIKPVPASRPRVTRWGTYYLKTYKTYKDEAHEAIPVCTEQTLNCELGATVEFICHRPKNTKMVSPRGDIDNHLKAIFDACVGQAATKKQECRLKKYIKDDELISHVDARMRYAKPNEEPCTIITVGRL